MRKSMERNQFSGPPVELSDLVDGMLADVEALPADPIAAEFRAALFVAMCEMAGEGYEDALVDGFVPEIETRKDSRALVMLLALGSVCGGRVATAAVGAAGRLTDAGVEPPDWAAGLTTPMSVGDCRRFADSEGAGAMLLGTFGHAGRPHAFVIGVDNTDCGAAMNMELLDVEGLPEVTEILRQTWPDEERLDPEEWRWQVERALDARAVHDGGELPFDEEGLPEYYPLATLLRSRLRAMPESGKPKPPHDDALTSFDLWLEPLPPQPAGPARVYQLKVGLKGAKPPIWRRLEVQADVTLDRLHAIIQTAFGWDGSHLHVFETPYGDFGIADAELRHRPADEVSLSQVLPAARSKMTYLYDFGDDWRHEILVEKVLAPDEAVTYPRCTGGRRAAPPEDSGGVWSYACMLEILGDPAHPDHTATLEWLGVENATEFDPSTFDAEAITKALTA